MAFLEFRSSLKFLNPPDARGAACVRTRPECIVLGVAEGVTPSPRPPVRVFLGTEPGQYRAERIFVWSIEQHRDPSRVYEVHLMKDLAGFDRRGWTTGFTNYRFAVPHLAGASGRAIFNDVDEAYTGDPAELFDLDMGRHGYLATSASETSVLLIDCGRMASIWTLELVQRRLKKEILAKTLAVPGIRGDLPSEWTARDEEYVEGRSKLQHWTTLQTQPWRPVPERFVYQPNPVGQLWFDMKRAADAAGYQVFTAERPSSLYRGLVERLRATPRRGRGAGGAGEGLRGLIGDARARTLLEFALDGTPDALPASSAPRASRHDLAAPPPARSPVERFDAVACSDLLEYLPDEDAPWVVDALFARAGSFVYARIGNDGRSAELSDGSRLASQPRPVSWWCELFEAAGQRHPQLYWMLEVFERDAKGAIRRRVRDGGRRLTGPPVVWVLVDERRENVTQAIALADALGWPYERKDLRAAWPELPTALLGASCRGLDRSSRAGLRPPWPDVVVAAGRCTAPVAQWIREQTLGRTRLVQVGREGGEVADCFDAVVTPAHAHLWPHPRRIETHSLLTHSAAKRLPRADAAMPESFGGSPHPRIALLIDASSGSRGLRPEEALQLGREVRAIAEESGGAVHAFAGSGIDPAAADALGRGLGERGQLHRLREGRREDGIASALASADVVVVPGDDELLLAEAATSGKPVVVAPPSPQPARPVDWLREWIRGEVIGRANERPTNRRGTARPQQGLEYLCARLVERGIVSPPVALDEFHRALYRLRIAQPLGTPLDLGARPVLRETDAVATRVRELLACPPAPEAADESAG
jgi:mitochondrial fission protein ELM1